MKYVNKVLHHSITDAKNETNKEMNDKKKVAKTETETDWWNAIWIKKIDKKHYPSTYIKTANTKILRKKLRQIKQK